MSIAAVGTSPAACATAPIRAPAPPGGLGSLVPVARPGEGVTLVLRRRAVPCDAAATPTTLILARHEAAPPPRPVARPGQPEADVPLVCDEGCDVRVGRTRLDDATRHALLTWLPPARRELLALEAGLLRDAPVVAVTLLLRPPTVWPLEEAQALRGLSTGGGIGGFAVLEAAAATRVGPRPLLRLRGAVARLEAHAPFTGLPLASATVGAGCAVLRDDRETAAAVAATLLARYARARVVADRRHAHAAVRAC